jgi:hypothetical protein
MPTYPALSIDGNRTFVSVGDDDFGWYRLNQEWVIRDPRAPSTDFHFQHVFKTSGGRWFLCGNFGAERWFGFIMGRNHRDYPEIDPAHAAHRFLDDGCELPPELRSVVEVHTTSGATPLPEAAAPIAAGNGKPDSGIATLDPASRAVAAAHELHKAGKPVSVRAACRIARVDRKNLAARHPETIELIERLGEPDRTPRKGRIDPRTGNLDAYE